MWWENVVMWESLTSETGTALIPSPFSTDTPLLPYLFLYLSLYDSVYGRVEEWQYVSAVGFV